MAQEIDELTFGELLLILRRRKGLSLEDIRDVTGIPTSTLSRWERGLYPPRSPVLQALAEVLEVEPALLVQSVSASFGRRAKARKLSQQGSLGPLLEPAA